MSQHRSPVQMKLVVAASLISALSGTKLQTSEAETAARSLAWESLELEQAYEAHLKKYNLQKASEKSLHHAKLAAFSRYRVKVATHNRNPDRSWDAEVNHFADYTPSEFQRSLGYRRMGQWWNTSRPELLQTETRASSIDWASTTAAGKHILDQGACGSCWAVAATGALEMHAEIKHKRFKALSYKELVDCAPNPKHCGGTGGCEGSTGELAYEYIKMFGLSAYETYTGNPEQTQTCRKNARSAVAQARSFVSLPVNKLEPLMDALQVGPVVVSVDAEPWSMYDRGIFDGCSRDATINHAVLLVGYGSSGNRDYWKVRNSWGRTWGESGYIRVKRHASDSGGDGYCGTDYDPKQGVGCDNGPKTIPVCGMCGILSDSCYPTDVSLS
eukprot:TRINITY_DN114803_c0_g1_i1.p1 TRINITY_DN114803_c0_g1~~TRINITY_DN114803_c0_g1_i1.p1  ORF type:complete len:386 (-),score=67.96 TRINITY_DN114803_c0_g1_i1:209-1366(-)